jgi:hypothetical protein
MKPGIINDDGLIIIGLYLWEFRNLEIWIFGYLAHKLDLGFAGAFNSCLMVKG